jgi:hypothetical protein
VSGNDAWDWSLAPKTQRSFTGPLLVLLGRLTLHTFCGLLSMCWPSRGSHQPMLGSESGCSYLPGREDAARNWVDLAGWWVKRLRLLHALKNEALPRGVTAVPSRPGGCGSRFSRAVSRAEGDEGFPVGCGHHLLRVRR